jgi:hypothetical protein
MSAKNEYKKLCADIAASVSAKGSRGYSKSDFNGMSHAMLNSPDHEVNIVVKGKDGEPTTVTTKPVEAYREALKDIGKQFGIDKAELDKVKDMNISKQHASAVADISLHLVSDYVKTGRKLNFPVSAVDQSQFSISTKLEPEKVTATKKIVQTEGGNYETVPTGKTVKTKAHTKLVAKNLTPPWLKSEV